MIQLKLLLSLVTMMLMVPAPCLTSDPKYLLVERMPGVGYNQVVADDQVEVVKRLVSLSLSRSLVTTANQCSSAYLTMYQLNSLFIPWVFFFLLDSSSIPWYFFFI